VAVVVALTRVLFLNPDRASPRASDALCRTCAGASSRGFSGLGAAFRFQGLCDRSASMQSRHAAALALVVALISVPALADTEAAFILPSGVKVKIIEAPFNKELFKVLGCTDSGPPCFINGHVPFGVAFGLPETYVKSILVSYQGQSYSLEVSDMYDAWGGRPLEHKGVVRYFGGKCFSTKDCQFRGLFSDAAGSFVAEWRIVNGMPIRTVLTDSNDIVNLFMKNIDPPEFD
jgi:hypothetical protein